MGVETLDQQVAFEQVLAPGEFADGIMIQVNTADVELVRLSAKPKETECKDIVMAHGEIVIDGGVAALRHHFRWRVGS